MNNFFHISLTLTFISYHKSKQDKYAFKTLCCSSHFDISSHMLPVLCFLFMQNMHLEKIPLTYTSLNGDRISFFLLGNRQYVRNETEIASLD